MWQQRTNDVYMGNKKGQRYGAFFANPYGFGKVKIIVVKDGVTKSLLPTLSGYLLFHFQVPF